MVAQFQQRSIVNAGMLRQNVGKYVTIMLKVEDETGSNLIATSTDGQQIRVTSETSLGARRGNWVEIIGKPEGGDVIKAEEAIVFSADNIDFDEEGYNMMVLFMNNCKEIFRNG